MQNWQYWLLVFGLWFNSIPQWRDGSTFSQWVVIIFTMGGFVALLWSIPHG